MGACRDLASWYGRGSLCLIILAGEDEQFDLDTYNKAATPEFASVGCNSVRSCIRSPTHLWRPPLNRPMLIACLSVALAAVVARTSDASDSIKMLVFIENGVGSSSQAQPHIDRLIAAAKQENGWSHGEGKYVTRRKRALKYIAKAKPSFGILTLGAYLGLRKKQGLKLLGHAKVKGAGGSHYHIVTKTAGALAGCKTLASNHLQDQRFINNVVANSSFSLSQFTIKRTRRPVQTLKYVIKGKTDCALIDNAQKTEMKNVGGGGDLKVLWSSAKLPAIAIVSFSGVQAAQRAKFKASLSKLCTGTRKTSCRKAGIQSMAPGGEARFSQLARAYER